MEARASYIRRTLAGRYGDRDEPLRCALAVHLGVATDQERIYSSNNPRSLLHVYGYARRLGRSASLGAVRKLARWMRHDVPSDADVSNETTVSPTHAEPRDEPQERDIDASNVIADVATPPRSNCNKRKRTSSICSENGSKRTRRRVLRPRRDQADHRPTDDDDLVVLSATRISLICPISNKRIQLAVRGANCTHPHCFDKSSFLGLSKKAVNRCPFAFCGQKIRAEDLVVDELFNNALRDAAPSIREVVMLDGSFKAVQVNDNERDVVDLDDDVPEVMDYEGQSESKIDPVLNIGTEVLEPLHAALKSIDSKLEAHKFAYLSDLRASFHELRSFAQQKFSTINAGEVVPVQLNVAKELHERSTEVFQLAAKHLQKCHHSTNPERASKQWLHDLVHETVALHSLIKERVVGAPKQNH